MDKKTAEEWFADLPIQTENIAYKPEQLIRCVNCERMNPPIRLNCFYCGGEHVIPESQKQFLNLKLRKLEAWEKGFNIILLPNAHFAANENLNQAAKILTLESESFLKLIETKVPMPAVRAESKPEAEIVQIRLRELGIETLIVSDEMLAADKPPRRLRGIEFFDDKLILILFNQDEIIEISPDDLALIVNGAIFYRKIEATEKHNKKGDNEILDATETNSDEILIDIYSRSDPNGFRIYAKGFDFSSLESEKELLAKANIKKLGDKLRLTAPDVKTVNDYLSHRILLANVWESDQRIDSQGLKRESFGKFKLGNVTTIHNLSQFTKYSRLQWHLL